MCNVAGTDQSPGEDGCSLWARAGWTSQRPTRERSSITPHSRVLQEGELFQVWGGLNSLCMWLHVVVCLLHVVYVCVGLNMCNYAVICMLWCLMAQSLPSVVCCSDISYSAVTVHLILTSSFYLFIAFYGSNVLVPVKLYWLLCLTRTAVDDSFIKVGCISLAALI